MGKRDNIKACKLASIKFKRDESYEEYSTQCEDSSFVDGASRGRLL